MGVRHCQETNDIKVNFLQFIYIFLATRYHKTITLYDNFNVTYHYVTCLFDHIIIIILNMVLSTLCMCVCVIYNLKSAKIFPCHVTDKKFLVTQICNCKHNVIFLFLLLRINKLSLNALHLLFWLQKK